MAFLTEGGITTAMGAVQNQSLRIGEKYGKLSRGGESPAGAVAGAGVGADEAAAKCLLLEFKGRGPGEPMGLGMGEDSLFQSIFQFLKKFIPN